MLLKLQKSFFLFCIKTVLGPQKEPTKIDTFIYIRRIKQPDIFVKKIHDFTLEGEIVQTSPPQTISIPIENLKQADFKINALYRGYSCQYESLRQYVLESFFDKIKIIFKIASQKHYNQRSFRALKIERIAVLRHIVDQTIEKPSYGKEIIELCTELYDKRIIMHPHMHIVQAQVNRVLKCLVISKDLECIDNLFYKMNAQAILTLEAYDERQQKHADTLATSNKMNRLTWWIVLFAAMNIGMMDYDTTFKSSLIFKVWKSI